MSSSGTNARRESYGVATLALRSSRRTELINITSEVQALVSESGCSAGVCHIYVPHTTAGVIINEGYDPDVARDMEVALDRLIPHKGDYRHAEGNSDSHIKTALVGSSQSVFIEQGRLGWAAGRLFSFASLMGRGIAMCG